MKSSYFLFFVVFVGFVEIVSCDEPSPPTDLRDRGTITGEDFRRCACCGGWFIEINQERYRFQEIPASTNTELLSSEYPIEVFIEWAPLEDACLGDEIEVVSMSRAN